MNKTFVFLGIVFLFLAVSQSAQIFYDPDLDTWERVADLDFPVTSAKMDILDGLPTLVGGFTGSYGNTDLIQYFEEEDRWIPLNGVKLEITRSSPVVFQVPKDYFNIC